MIENEAKGWHGSYSSVGRISAEKFPMVLIKDQIIKGRYKKKKMKDYFSSEEDLNNKIILDEGDDIFNSEHKTKIKLKKRRKEICKPNAKKKLIPEEYKYHNLHHKDLFNFKKRLKNQTNLNSTAYDPKKDFVWSKTLTGPQWNSLCGREKGGIFKSDIESITPKSKLIKYIKDSKLNTFYSLKRGVPMDKMNQRGIIPTYYDLRIRNDKPFINNNKTTDAKNNINNLNKKELNQLNLNSISDISFKQTTDQINDFSKNQKIKKSLCSSPNININNAISFAKNLSREQYYFVRRNREGVRPFFNPKYNLVEPRSLTMVSFNKKLKGKSKPKRLEGIDIVLFFDPDKIISKVNSHRENSVPIFKYMSDKNDEKGKLPSYMHNIFNRGSLEIMTEKGLKMNNFSKADIKNDYSTFCRKKSFNKIINFELLKNEKINEDTNLENLTKKLGKNRRLKNMMEFYTKNLDDDKIQYTGNKFDSVTLKSIKTNGKLNMKEKQLFSINYT